MVKIRYMSDLHLEFYNNVNKLIKYIEWSEEDSSSYLILAGDIGIPINKNDKENVLFLELLTELRKRFLGVIMISGNHEYYNCVKNKSYKYRTLHDIEIKSSRNPLTIGCIDEILKSICNKVGVHFLQCDSITIEDVTIYGCTLFTDVSEECYNSMNDHKIGTRSDILNTHFEHFEWLKTIKKDVDEKVIILTHHVPFANETTHSGYHVDVIEDVQKIIDIDYWICGHTHHDINKEINGTKVLSSCIGYPGELERKSPKYITI